MPVKFVRRYPGSQPLYEAEAGPGRLLFIATRGCDSPYLDLTEAWTSLAIQGTFVYAAGDIGETADTASTLIQAVLARVGQAGAPRGFAWLADPAAWQTGQSGLTAANTPVLGLNPEGNEVSAALNAPVVSEVRLTVALGAVLAVGDTSVQITGAVAFAGNHAPAGPAAQAATLSCGPGTLGLLTFSTGLTRGSLLANSSWGFQFAHPGPDDSTVHEWFALADGTPEGGLIGFAAQIDPSDPANSLSGPAIPARSRLAFTGKDGDGTDTALPSTFRTRQGATVTLFPLAASPALAALAFNNGPGGTMQLSPAGDFELGCDLAPDPAALMCGLNGTEAVTFHPRRPGLKGDVVRFTPYQPAYAPRFPFPDASPVSAPADAAPELLDGKYLTSWAGFAASRGDSPAYIAQPKGAPLYGQDKLIWNPETDLMGWQTPADPLPAAAVFPLAPYAGLDETATDLTTAADFEREIIGPVRRSHVPAVRSATPGTSAGPGAGGYTTVTPTGLLVTVQDNRWVKILLGQTLDRGMYFCNPTAALQRAFQSGDLLLVAANRELGRGFKGTGGCEGNVPTFANSVVIDGWELTANTGTANNYADYSNVMIVKGRRGRLYDPADPAGSLLSNPARWTAPVTFSAPSDVSPDPEPPPPDPAETVVLAQWLKDYFAAAAKARNPGLARFNAIARDENWTGILILRADITAVPADLTGILAGITDVSAFHAHHLGIEITPVSAKQGSVPGPTVQGASSMFGLIDYTDPAFTPPDPGQPAQAVRPTLGRTYDFRLLSLKVSFENTAVSSFRSYAQLTATSWFDTRVARMGGGGNPYRAIVLEGTLQSDEGQPVYNMSSQADTIFYFAHDVLAKLEVTGAVMSTRATGHEQDITDPEPLARSWFGLTGFLDFKVPRVTTEAGSYDFDVFSFGSEPAEADQPRRGLAYSDLGILMTFPPARPADSELALDADQVRFDPVTSTARPGSLFRQFALDVAGMRDGTALTPPLRAGYSQVVTPARLTGVTGGRWWGIDYRLPLGTPGNLAGRTALTAHLLTAWAANPRQGLRPRELPDEQTVRSYAAAVAVSLPGSESGAKLISLQNVLRLSVGQIRLLYDTDKEQYLLLFSEIALKLFGMLSIPPGSTMFSLFGDSADGGVGANPSGLGWYAMYRKSDGGAA